MPIERILYGGTCTLLDVSLRRLGIDTTFVLANQPEALAVVIRSTTRAFSHVFAFRGFVFGAVTGKLAEVV